MKRIVLGTLLSSVAAFALQVHPIPVELEQGKKYREFTIDDDSGKYQVYLKKWTQDAKGQEVLEDTDAVVAYPKVLQAPKKIKVYKKRSTLIPQEESYRLILKELNVDKIEGQTRVLKTLSIPVFILPNTQKAKIEL
ncbi:MAG: molecular chaperone, partial [Campylobacteraceae bacterium]|nr:molecular chaperone [Campylobacteraceae bacterium]